MDKTPKMPRRSSLSLNKYINHKRHGGSPQGRLRLGKAKVTAKKESVRPIIKSPRSPSVISVFSDVAECYTPPHKCINLDDSLESSQKLLDISYSPSGLLSQTLPTESPEVGWRWARQKSSVVQNLLNTTPDSAYAGDSSFTSADSSTKNKCIKTRHKVNTREQERKTIEFELHRAEKSRADQMLKKRCAKLEEQLKDTKIPKEIEYDTGFESVTVSPTDTCRMNLRSSTHTEMQDKQLDLIDDELQTNKKANTTLNDFLNDSDSDCLLLEATQQMESKITNLTQITEPLNVNDNNSYEFTKSTNQNIVNNVTVLTAASNEKRSSLYMKFLEDDSQDDWFTSFDDVIEQAMQTKKPRNSFQRYKSMPTKTTCSTIAQSNDKSAKDTITSKGLTLKNASNIVRSNIDAAHNNRTEVTKFKRHASSHTISPSSSKYRERNF